MKCFNSKREGFTLIELLVVISIISFLSSVIISNLKSVRDKAADSAVKTTLSSMHSQASIYYDTSSSYAGLCASNVLKLALTSAASSTNSSVRVNTGGSTGSVTCNATTTGWAIQAPLKTNANNFFCVDSNLTSVITNEVFADGNTIICGAAVASGGGGPSAAKVLVIAGGGGGSAGGGGAGGVVYNAAYTVTAKTYSVTVGDGGSGHAPNAQVGDNGVDSTFDGTIIAVGGGGGGKLNNGEDGISGGSGGGGGFTGITSHSPFSGGAATQADSGGGTGYGFAGGTTPTDIIRYSSGGGGAGGVGGDSTATISGSGGQGIADAGVGNLLSVSSSGVGGFIAGGGGGSYFYTGPSGDHLGNASAGGGSGGDGTNGILNTGGGGGGGYLTSGFVFVAGGTGGSGVVIISFDNAKFSYSYTGANSAGLIGSERWVKMTTNGTLTLTAK